MKTILFLTGAVLSLGMLAYHHPSEYGFIPPCQFSQWTGLFCSGCGATRAVHFLLRGDWKMSLHYNPLVLLFLPILLLLLFQWFCEIYRKGNFHFPIKAKLYLGIAIVVVLFFVLRNLPFAGFDILRPP